MPGHVECCWLPIASWLASALPGVKVSLRLEYWPLASRTLWPELRRPLAEAESHRALQIAREFNLYLVP
jgi:putative pyruvate formate lyase activating enzyme